MLTIRRLALPFFLFIFSLIVIPTTHYAFSGKFQYSSGANVFMINHLIETGISGGKL
ncbi:hypothetical protein OAU25_00155 [Crocinitomicaceae bacterium]|nr:hypothetical protein [Crocinitomicaceae bacterium]